MYLSSISLIIPVYNGGDSFKQCLTSITQSHHTPDEVIVVADGDTDGSWQVAESFGAKVLRFPTPGGPARARNLGASVAQGDILFFVDADVELHPNTLSLVLEAFQQHDDIAALIGSYDDAPGAVNFLSQYKNLFHHYTHQTSSSNAFTFWGACGAIRRSIFNEMGGFDERYLKPCVEDIELGYRLKQAGHSIRLCKNIQVKHLKEWKPISLLRAEIFYRAIPWTELILDNPNVAMNLNLSLANRLSVILTLMLILSIMLGFFLPIIWFSSLIILIALLMINREIYHFFYINRGLRFTLQVIPWHWFYFLYGGMAFAYSSGKYYLAKATSHSEL
ncbi:MAG: glycosyltransferase family 2 protein [Leptolyngbyaceae bacterium]|nr:glycosyltransferase family 2 protein [Leptolyngbyaceae bacterium]